MKILELTNYSSGICGVWARAREEAVRLAERGHIVKVFSSDFIKGKEGRASKKDKIGKVEIRRFPGQRLGGESFMSWNFEEEALKFKPDVIIAHSYRHFHTTKALEVGDKIGCKVILVTHAPFVEKEIRGKINSAIVKLYDSFFGRKALQRFDKIITITKWEVSYLKALGVSEEKIAYIPNGIPEEFFDWKVNAGDEKKILFLGRVSRIKQIETTIEAISLLKDKEIKLEIIGPAEAEYGDSLIKLAERFHVENRVSFLPPVYNLKDKIKAIDSAKLFVLPSKRESMPQSLIEAMARERVVIASRNKGTDELVSNGETGFLFESGNSRELASIIEIVLREKGIDKICKRTRESVKRFSWAKVIIELDKEIKRVVKG